MGMTYTLSALPPNQTLESLRAAAADLPQWDESKPQEEIDACFEKWDAFWKGLHAGMHPLTDDMVFDRERLGSWMQLKTEDFVFPDGNGLFIIKPEHVSRAIATLEALQEKISSMHFDSVLPNEIVYNRREWDSERDCWNNEYHGTPNNVAIYKEAEKVLLRANHFTFPWETPDWKTIGRVAQMIAALRRVQDFMCAAPERMIIGEYY